MLIDLSESQHFRYIRIHPSTHSLCVLLPVIAGVQVSTDNTCKSDVELKIFFDGSAIRELITHQSTLTFQLALLNQDDPNYPAITHYLTVIKAYISLIEEITPHYKNLVEKMLEKSSNLYPIQLRPSIQDAHSSVTNPVFSVDRTNDSHGVPCSELYKHLQAVFETASIEKSNPRTVMVDQIVRQLPQQPSFDDIKTALKLQCMATFNTPINVDYWTQKASPDQPENQIPITQEFMNLLMGFHQNTSSEDYIRALLSLCAPNLWKFITGSPFYIGVHDSKADQIESLSLMTQFYLGYLNVYCRSNRISLQNFGMTLDASSELSHILAHIVANALQCSTPVESAIVDFFNNHPDEFELTRAITPEDALRIAQTFNTTYRTITATQENPYMDDFMFLEEPTHETDNVFISSNGLICTNLLNITPNRVLQANSFTPPRGHHQTLDGFIEPNDAPAIKRDISLDVLIERLDSEQWTRLPPNVVEACRTLPLYQVRTLLSHVAKGEQDSVPVLLDAATDAQTLLKTPGRLTDYSNRIFHCTAYEYAYWAKDTHMQRLLEQYMNHETKQWHLEKINTIERHGLVYQQRGITYQNAHYDTSFSLKNLTEREFYQLQWIVGEKNAKIRQASVDTYQHLSFNATEYQALQGLLQKPTGMMLSLLHRVTPAKTIKAKLQFDFYSLIIALDYYATHYDHWTSDEQQRAWLSVGKAQRDVPAHIAHEYCRLDRSFDPVPLFSEHTLPRNLLLNNFIHGSVQKQWFPLSTNQTGLGFEFAITNRQVGARGGSQRGSIVLRVSKKRALIDLTALRRLDEVRSADLLQSHANLSASMQSAMTFF